MGIPVHYALPSQALRSHWNEKRRSGGDNTRCDARRLGNMFRILNGRGDRIRTCGLMVPNHARYHLRYAPLPFAIPREPRRQYHMGIINPFQDRFLIIRQTGASFKEFSVMPQLYQRNLIGLMIIVNSRKNTFCLLRCLNC